MGKRKLRKYTPEQRSEALKLAEEAGYREAALRLGIPEGTVSCWMSQARRASAEGSGDDSDSRAADEEKKKTEAEDRQHRGPFRFQAEVVTRPVPGLVSVRRGFDPLEDRARVGQGPVEAARWSDRLVAAM